MNTLWCITRKLCEEQVMFIKRTVDADDTIVLIQDGVYMLLDDSFDIPCKIYSLQSDIHARGIDKQDNLISYSEMIDCIFRHKKTISL